MRVLKCDLCRRPIKGNPVIAGNGYLQTVDLCEKCGLPIVKFLRKNKFLEKEKNFQKQNAK